MTSLASISSPLAACAPSTLCLDPVERVVSPFVKTSTVYLGQDVLIPLSCVGSAYLKWQSMSFAIIKHHIAGNDATLDDLVQEQLEMIKLLVESKHGYSVK